MHSIAETHAMNCASNVLRANNIWNTDIFLMLSWHAQMFPKENIWPLEIIRG